MEELYYSFQSGRHLVVVMKLVRTPWNLTTVHYTIFNYSQNKSTPYINNELDRKHIRHVRPCSLHTYFFISTPVFSIDHTKRSLVIRNTGEVPMYEQIRITHIITRLFSVWQLLYQNHTYYNQAVLCVVAVISESHILPLGHSLCGSCYSGISRPFFVWVAFIIGSFEVVPGQLPIPHLACSCQFQTGISYVYNHPPTPQRCLRKLDDPLPEDQGQYWRSTSSLFVQIH